MEIVNLKTVSYKRRIHMLKQIKPDRLYFIIDVKEPYANKIFEVLKEGQMALNDWPEGKDITFRDWIFETFGQVGLNYLDSKKSSN